MAATFIQARTDTTDTNVYTFSAQSFGPESSDRHIIVTVVSRKSGASTTISGITIGGVTATIVRQVTNTVTNTDVAGIAIASVPTGATGDIVVTFGATMVRCAIGVYIARNLTSITSSDNDSSTAADPTVTLDIPADGFAIGVGLTAAASSAAWTGLNENFDSTLESFVTYTGAMKNFPAEATGETITIDFGSSTESVGVFASWSFEPTLTEMYFLPRFGFGVVQDDSLRVTESVMPNMELVVIEPTAPPAPSTTRVNYMTVLGSG